MSGGNGSERNGKEGRGPIPQSSRQREPQRRRRGCRCYKFKGSLGSEGEPALRSRGREVPEVVVRRRFDRSIINFLVHYRPAADSWMLFDNTGISPVVVALGEKNRVRVIEEKLYNAVIKDYGAT